MFIGLSQYMPNTLHTNKRHRRFGVAESRVRRSQMPWTESYTLLLQLQSELYVMKPGRDLRSTIRLGRLLQNAPRRSSTKSCSIRSSPRFARHPESLEEERKLLPSGWDKSDCERMNPPHRAGFCFSLFPCTFSVTSTVGGKSLYQTVLIGK